MENAKETFDIIKHDKRELVEDEELAGRPSSSRDIKNVKQFLDSNRGLLICLISEELSLSHGTFRTISATIFK